MVDLDRFGKSCDNHDDLSDILCVPNNSGHLNVKVFNNE